MSESYRLREWKELAVYEAHGGVAAGLVAKAREAVLDDLALVLAYERLQEAIPAKLADLEARRVALVAAEADLEALDADRERLAAEAEGAERRWRKLDAVKSRSNDDAQAAWEAEQAWARALKAATVAANEYYRLHDANTREADRLARGPDGIERLRKIRRPETPNLDMVLTALGLLK